MRLRISSVRQGSTAPSSKPIPGTTPRRPPRRLLRIEASPPGAPPGSDAGAASPPPVRGDRPSEALLPCGARGAPSPPIEVAGGTEETPPPAEACVAERGVADATGRSAIPWEAAVQHVRRATWQLTHGDVPEGIAEADFAGWLLLPHVPNKVMGELDASQRLLQQRCTDAAAAVGHALGHRPVPQGTVTACLRFCEHAQGAPHEWTLLYTRVAGARADLVEACLAELQNAPIYAAVASAARARECRQQWAATHRRFNVAQEAYERACVQGEASVVARASALSGAIRGELAAQGQRMLCATNDLRVALRTRRDTKQRSSEACDARRSVLSHYISKAASLATECSRALECAQGKLAAQPTELERLLRRDLGGQWAASTWPEVVQALHAVVDAARSAPSSVEDVVHAFVLRGPLSAVDRTVRAVVNVHGVEASALAAAQGSVQNP